MNDNFKDRQWIDNQINETRNRLLKLEEEKAKTTDSIKAFDLQEMIDKTSAELEGLNSYVEKLELVDSTSGIDSEILSEVESNLDKETDGLSDIVEDATGVQNEIVNSMQALNEFTSDQSYDKTEALKEQAGKIDTLSEEEKAKLIEEMRQEYRLEVLREKVDHPIRTLFNAMRDTYNDIADAKRELYESGANYQSLRSKAANTIASVNSKTYSSVFAPMKDATLNTIATTQKKAAEVFKNVATKTGEFLAKTVADATHKSFAINDFITGGIYKYQLGKNGIDSSHESKMRARIASHVEKKLEKHPNSALYASYYNNLVAECDNYQKAEEELCKNAYGKVESVKLTVKDNFNKIATTCKESVKDSIESVKNKAAKLHYDYLSTKANCNLKTAEFFENIMKNVDKLLLRYENNSREFAKVHKKLNDDLAKIGAMPINDLENTELSHCKEIEDEISTIKEYFSDEPAVAKILIDKRTKLLDEINTSYDKKNEAFKNKQQFTKDILTVKNDIQFVATSAKSDINITKLKAADKLYRSISVMVDRFSGKAEQIQTKMKTINFADKSMDEKQEEAMANIDKE